MKKFVLHQTRVPTEMISKLKLFAARKSLDLREKVFLKDVYSQALHSFFSYRLGCMDKGSKIAYLAGPSRGPGSSELNVIIPKDLSFRVKRISETDSVSNRRLLYTALVHFCRENNLQDVEDYMSISLKIPDKTELVTRKFKIPSDLSEEFDLYVEAGREDNRDMDEHMVMEAILKKTLTKDKAFQAWAKKRDSKNNC
ncbi:hypothetical protein PITCH_A1370002 [uncultured Desulfobacterium sp.]|uniref:Uncharacterized protein n=1 Tax=uncultured Desulfobacterium sp. TaxID=201089 RepID=A0A445MSL4_9BACT|nr:hypothetical protein PITCH_A1370002 [uncultured Desulfobacterium sp.]